MPNTETLPVQKPVFIDDIFTANLDISQQPIGSEWSLVLSTNDQLETHPELGKLTEYVLGRSYYLTRHIRKTNLYGVDTGVKMTLVKTGKDELTFFSILRERKSETYVDTPLVVVRLSLAKSLPMTKLGNKTEAILISQPDSYNVLEKIKHFRGLPVGVSFDLNTLGYRLIKILSEIREKDRGIYEIIVSEKSRLGLNKAIVMHISDKPALVLYNDGDKGGAKLVLSELEEQAESYPGYVIDVVLGITSETIIPKDDLLWYNTHRHLDLTAHGLMGIRKMFGKGVFDLLSDFCCKPIDLFVTERYTTVTIGATAEFLESLSFSGYMKYFNHTAQVSTTVSKDIPSGVTGKQFSEILGIDPDFINRIVCENSAGICGKEYDGGLLREEEFECLVLEEYSVSLILSSLGSEKSKRHFASGRDAMIFFKEVILKKAPENAVCEVYEGIVSEQLIEIRLVQYYSYASSEEIGKLILTFNS